MHTQRLLYKVRIIQVSILLGVLLFPICFTLAEAPDHPVLYLFWGDGCPHCEKEKEFLEQLHDRYPELEMRWFETWDHREFADLADAMRKAHEIKGPGSVPMTFLGEYNLVGYLSEEITGIEIEEQVLACLKQGCADALGKVRFHPIAQRVQDEAAQNAPKDWQLFPSDLQKQE